MRRIGWRGVVLASLSLLLPVAVGACDSSTGSTTTPTTPDTASVTETFSDTVRRSGSKAFAFTQAASGTITIGLNSVSPLSTMALGVAIGSWSDPSCTTITRNDNARAGATAITGTAAAGSYCILVYDSGNVPSDWTVTYAVQVVHY